MFNFIMTGDDLRRIRLSANRSTEEMAKIAGVNRTTYERWERGIGFPRGDKLIMLLLYCKFDISQIIDGVEALKTEFSQYKDLDHDEQPNSYRISKKKNHLRPFELEGEPESENR
ncbi:helix-turn-helix transcriptional regulator [Thalassomonas viridans]|uniref:Helix-turn-helix transcriptional regulator n=1 Tax=Thalassomonas viridans TaxID=137584 RepID=A0AAE9ZB47_9GAMM|nr:helix-turn-helix transcriptional regulator [Thalassomonas viridans]WDE09004.1 helix-turn-helix transcriptional regulator [Thalassomonas viridans]